jgi:hypothetical protein
LVPVAIGYFLLRANEDAYLLQVQRTHTVAATTAARRVDAYLGSLRALAVSAAGHPALQDDPRSAVSQELLGGILRARSEVAAVGVFAPSGETVVLAQRADAKAEVAAVIERLGAGVAGDGSPRIVRGAEGRWIVDAEALPGEVGWVVLIADVEPLDEVVQNLEIGEEALLVLVGGDRRVAAGGTGIDSFPPRLVALAASGKIDSQATRWQEPPMEDLIVAYAQLRDAPWFVLSRQPARTAEVAARRLRNAGWIAGAGALFLTGLLSGGAHLTVIRPLRRLARAQSELAGVHGGVGVGGGGSEIDQLEASFELLQKRIRDSEDLGKVFLGRYQVTDLVGSGAMGSVFRGWDPKLRRPVALKTVRLESEEFDRQKLIASLLEEAAISARFHHPNIVTVYDVADEGTAAFIAMEYVEGVSLDAYLWERGVLSPDEVIPLGAAIARALATAHEHQLVHHDVKPGNVLLGYDGSVKVTDFGISQLLSAATRTRDVICGTPGYIAPECFAGEPYTVQADLFSLGLILYEALAGIHPFFGRNLRETMANTMTVEPEPLANSVRDLPPELDELITRLLAKEPADRPADAGEVAATLERMAAERGLTWSPRRESLESLRPEAPRTASPPSGTRTRLLSIAGVGERRG